MYFKTDPIRIEIKSAAKAGRIIFAIQKFQKFPAG